MLRSSVAWTALAATLWLCVQPAAAQTKKALQIVPADSLGFVVINNIGQANDKVTKLAGKMKLPIPGSPLAMLQQELGLEGLNEKGTAVVIGVMTNQGPGMVVALPVTDYAKAAKSLNAKDVKGKTTEGSTPGGERLLIGKRDGYLLIAPNIFQAALDHVVNSKKSVKVGSFGAWIGTNDVSAVATKKGIELGVGMLLQEIQKAKAALADLPPEAQAAAVIIDDAVKLIELAGKELTGIGVGGQIDAKFNVHVRSRVAFVKNGKISAFAKKIKAPKGGPLAGLPNGNLIVALGGSFPQELMEKLVGVSTKLMQSSGQIPADKMKKIADIYVSMTKGTKGMSFVMHVNEPGQPLFGSNMVSIVQTADAQAYLKNYHDAMGQLSALMKDIKAPGLPGMWKSKMTKVNGKPALEISMDLTANLPAEPAQKKIIESMFGEDGKMHAVIVAASKTQLVTTYGSAKSAAKLLVKMKKGGLGGNTQIVAMSKHLPKGSQWVGYVSLKGITQIAGQFAAQFAGIQIPPFPPTPPIAFGERISGTGVDASIVIPIGVLENAMQYIEQLKRVGQ